MHQTAEDEWNRAALIKGCCLLGDEHSSVTNYNAVVLAVSCCLRREYCPWTSERLLRTLCTSVPFHPTLSLSIQYYHLLFSTGYLLLNINDNLHLSSYMME